MKFEFSRKTKNIIFISTIICVVIIGIYIAGIGTQIIQKYMLKTDIKLLYDPINCFKYAFDFKISRNMYIGEGIFLLVLFLVRWRYSNIGTIKKGEKDKSGDFYYSKDDTYGSAKMLTEKQTRIIYRVSSVNKLGTNIDTLISNGETIIGYMNETKKEYVCSPLSDDKKEISYNKNIAINGGPGSKKTRTEVMNYILQSIERGNSIIVSDTKGELYTWTAKYARKRGYKTKILNFVEKEYSDGWDILGEIKNNPEMATILADTIIKNTGGEKGDEFWNSAEQNALKSVLLLKAIGECDVTNMSGRKATMGDVYRFIATEGESGMDAAFGVIEEQFPTHPSIIPYKQFKNAGKDNCGKILHGLGNRLQLFQDEQLCKITGTKDIDLELPAKEKCIYYLRFSDQVSTYEFLTSLFFTFLYIKLVNFADRQPKRRCPVPVNFLLDEFCNIGYIPDFTKKISTVRSRDINTVVVFQNIPQLQNRYPDGAWEEIISDCDLMLFLGCGNELTTPDYISQLTGEATIAVESNSQDVQSMHLKNTSSSGKRYVKTAGEIRQLDPKHLLCITKGTVAELRKMDFTQHPKAQFLEDELVTEHHTIVDSYIPNYENFVLTGDYRELKRRKVAKAKAQEAEKNKTTSKDSNDDTSTNSDNSKPKPRKKAEGFGQKATKNHGNGFFNM